MKPDFGVPGQRVLVTAGAGGIGKAIATTFADAGARVHICDVDQTALASFSKERPDISASIADVSDVAQVDALFETVKRQLGGLDVLVNNAGIAGPTGRIEDIAIADWERCIAVDLNGLYYCTRLAMPMIKAAGGGSIINLSSAAGRLGFPLRSPYAAAKWAVVGLTASLAIEAGQDGVRVNCIQPGFVHTEATGNSFSPALADDLVARSALRRSGQPHDVASLAVHLAKPESSWITGQVIAVDGGMTVQPMADLSEISRRLYGADAVDDALGRPGAGTAAS